MEKRSPQQRTPNQPSRPPNPPDNNLRPHPPDVPPERRAHEHRFHVHPGMQTPGQQDHRRREDIKRRQAGAGERVPGSRAGLVAEPVDEAERCAEQADHERQREVQGCEGGEEQAE